mgnify:CR=1 FL=1
MRLYVNGKQTDPLSLPDVRDYLDKKPLSVTTSGTTGHPKTVEHSHELMKQVVKSNISTMRHHKDSKLFSILSPNGIGYQALMVYCAVEADCDLYLETFNFKTYIDRIHEVRPTYTILPPNLWKVMSKRPSWQTLDLSSLETFLMGSDFTPTGALDELRSHGAKRVVNAYGSTEAPPFVMVSEEENTYSIEDAAPNCEIAISDRNTLLCKWAAQDEWWDSEDLVEGDLDTFVMKGRERNMFKQDRVRVYPEEVEKIATEKGAELALCQQKGSYANLYFVGNMNVDAVKSILHHVPRLRLKNVETIKVDNNLGKIIRNQELG